MRGQTYPTMAKIGHFGVRAKVCRVKNHTRDTFAHHVVCNSNVYITVKTTTKNMVHWSFSFCVIKKSKWRKNYENVPF